jgi:hypothetical protein
MTPEECRQRARAAAFEQWAKTPNRTARTAAARADFQERTPESTPGRFELQVDPNLELAPEVRAKMAESARRAYFAWLAFNSARARKARKAGGGDAA